MPSLANVSLKRCLSLSYMAVEKLTFLSSGFAVIYNISTAKINTADIKITVLYNNL